MKSEKDGFKGHSGAWTFFLLFAASNAALSYLQLSLVEKLWIVLGGILLPMGWVALRTPSGKSFPVLGDEWLPLTPRWLASLFLTATLALRLFKPLTFLSWPLFDETVNGYYALGLDRQWTWNPFFFFSQLPPLFIWFLCLLFKTLGSFLAAIRWEPILISILVLPAAYAAARAFFSRSFSLLYLALMGFSFWALFFARISHQGVLLVLWEYLAIAALGLALGSSGPARNRWLVLLGFLLGTGFYTYFSWPLPALWVGTLALGAIWKEKRARLVSFLCLALPILACLAPLFLALLQGQYGSYFQFLWTLKTRDSGLTQLETTCYCLSSFLWGNGHGDFYYGPVWGGFFNPVLGAALLVGSLELWVSRQQPESRAVLIGIPLFLLPGFVTNSLTDMREIQVLPLLTFLAALGLGSLAAGLSRARGLLFLGAFLALSAGLDFIHLLKFGDYINGYWKSQKTAESAKAFGILDQVRAKDGPGLILTAYSNDVYTYDQSLLVSTYPFNALLNPRLSPASTRWLAVVTNAHFQPFLARRFPEAQFTRLSKQDETAGDNFNGGLMLMVVPLTSKNRPLLGSWMETDRLFRDMAAQVMNLPIAEARRATLRILSQALPGLPKDPFIRSCYWEAVYFNFNWENLYGNRDVKTNFPAAVQALQRALREGYPTAYFYNELGSCYALAGDYTNARRAFEQAIRAPLNLTPAADNLKALEALQKASAPTQK